ncbi:MAG: lytic murein transglycosylase, partial [Burkholderiaceae bacterium]|nr:lytic murein transglycosylase [Burkholderiaceae bacterium]
ALIDLPNADAPASYYLGAPNFYVITRYNRASFYAMAVYELSRALLAGR